MLKKRNGLIKKNKRPEVFYKKKEQVQVPTICVYATTICDFSFRMEIAVYKMYVSPHDYMAISNYNWDATPVVVGATELVLNIHKQNVLFPAGLQSTAAAKKKVDCWFDSEIHDFENIYCIERLLCNVQYMWMARWTNKGFSVDDIKTNIKGFWIENEWHD